MQAQGPSAQLCQRLKSLTQRSPRSPFRGRHLDYGKAKPFCLIASAFYRLGYLLHHKLFLRPSPRLRTPVVIVGSYLAGGAGKTPFTIWLARHYIKQSKKVAVLCHRAAWDEQKLLQKELPKATVIATSNRYETAKKIQDKFDIILCDDGFEDSRFTGAKRICLDWQEPPQAISNLIPAGPFRSLKQDHDESEIIHLNCHGNNGTTPDVRFSIESITNVISGTTLSAAIICGLGNPTRFINDVRTFGVNIEKAIISRDHDKHFAQIVTAELLQNKDIVISQKDACRLTPATLSHPKLHVAIQSITVSNAAEQNFKKQIFRDEHK